MKIIKGIGYVVVAVSVFLLQFAAPMNTEIVEAKAKTLRTLKNELAQLEKELEENEKEQETAQSGIDSSKRRINEISKEKEDIQTEISDLTKEINELNSDIVDMNEEVKDILNYYQLSTVGESSTLEYIFESEDYTEFIYRMAITEQLSEHNDDTINDYNKKISDNENKKVELADKQVSLNNKEVELEDYIKSQKSILNKSLEGAVDIKEEISALKKNISEYERLKCKLDETIDECMRGKLPSGSSLYRPIVVGRVSSNYGGRTYKLNGRWTSDFHYGLDMSGQHGQTIYSAGNGKVAAIFRYQSCGGNMVYINHIINGKKYTTGYYHMASVSVSVGQTVTYDTKIGAQGGNPRIETWDHCSTGSHVHFTVSTGNWGNDFSSYSGFISRNINPRTVVNAPALGGSFSNRSTKY